MNLEYKMYGMVPYQLSGRQMGIQFTHAVVEYGRLCSGIPNLETQYNQYADIDKTIIMLNGGTTNDNVERLGTMQKHLAKIRQYNILCAEFREPDLGDQLLAFVFLVDERVFNRKKYPDFNVFLIDKHTKKMFKKYSKEDGLSIYDYDGMVNFLNRYDELYVLEQYKHWVEVIGGQTNLFLREFLPKFDLA